ncbi:hypothetical protein ACEXQD_10135 [Herbiconiux sp. P15]|uniref:DUF6984 family protein n=1 Tax=Herbiconiux liukaitaii TaxID=3342799 RepID=UPI0035BB7E04
MSTRHLSTEEESFVRRLLSRSVQWAHLAEGLSEALVEEMRDGGMGSLRFHPELPRPSAAIQIIEALFVDTDGVAVSATINIDAAGRLLELDVFKGDFSPLLALPVEGDVVRFRDS